ncbi:uncharacterized protein LOC144104308 isoform X1 [Amblyomma americanum]
MPVKALIRGFKSPVPQDLQVTFYDDLPPDAVCSQCDNVSAVLHRDPRGHGYCTSCRNMCTDRNLFKCSVCRMSYRLSQLTTDESTEGKIALKKIICPKTTEKNPVYITFSALKVHLVDCPCFQVAHGSEVSDHASPVTMSPCSYCKDQVPKKLMMQHMKECKDKGKELRDSRTEGAMVPEQPDPKTSSQNAPSQDLTDFVKESLSEIRGLKNEVAELKVALRQKDEQIQQLNAGLLSTQNDVGDLKKALAKKEGESELLTETVQSHQIDMKNMQAQCDKDHEVLKQMTSDMQEMTRNFEAMSTAFGETNHQLHVIEGGLKNSNDHFSASLNKIQEEIKQAVQDGMLPYLSLLSQLQAKHDALKNAYDSLVFQLFQPQQSHQQFHSSHWGQR